MNTKDIIYIVIILVLLGVVGFFLTKYATTETATNPTESGDVILPVEPDGGIGDGAEPLEVEKAKRGDKTEIGSSNEGNPIVAYHFGTGENEILLIGGIHGGYSWNTSLLAYEMIDYLDMHSNEVPESVTVTIIPSLNPDGLKSTVGTFGRFDSNDALLLSETTRIAGRFNANDVDLNRNFDCDWEAESTWRSRAVSGGTAPFSEPEAEALRDYVEEYNPVATVVWFSAEGKVYPSACGGNPSNASRTLASTFANAANYPTELEFDAYTINGDMVNWLAKEEIPAISVLLSNHTDTEFEKNWSGVAAILSKYDD